MLMMKKIYMTIVRVMAVAALALGLSSCLEKTPGDYIPETESMKTLNGAEQVLTGIYTAYMSSGLYSGYLTLCPDVQSDLVYAVQGNTNTMGNIWQWEDRKSVV